MASSPRIIAAGTAQPPYSFPQHVILNKLCTLLFEPGWEEHPATMARVARFARLFNSSRVEHRRTIVDLLTYYDHPRSTGERMAEYRRSAYPLAHTALSTCIADAGPFGATAITDFFVVSCTGYDAPGLDLLLARDLGMSSEVRRTVIGHMGCFGGIVGLRQSLAALRAHENSLVALLSVELCSLHYSATEDPEVLTGFALFADGIAALLLSADPDARGPELVDTHCVAIYDAAAQMSWRITDEGFMMGLSPRVPITLRQHVISAVERLLAPHGMAVRDITHWLVHPGGPSILEVIQSKLGLSDEQIAPSWRMLRDHGNCSSATVLIMLDALLRSGHTRHGEWGVMMAFGPGLTLEMCLLHF